MAMRKYVCIRKCFFQGKRYRPKAEDFSGDVLETDAPASTIPQHFTGGKMLTTSELEEKARLEAEEAAKKGNK